MTEDELKAAFASLYRWEGSRPPDYTWARHRWELRRHVERDGMSRFLAWSTVAATMFTGDVPFVQEEHAGLAEAGWLGLLDEPGLGDPPRLPYDPSTSGNLVHQAYHLLTWTRATGLDIANLRTILEFGGGYGGLAVIAWRLGFRGRYYLWDFPELALIQKYYLSNVLPPGAIDHFEWDAAGAGADLLIGCYSVSEADEATRRAVLGRDFGSCLIAYQDRYDDIDNNDWFEKYVVHRPDVDWRFIYKDFQPGHHYLIGVT